MKQTWYLIHRWLGLVSVIPLILISLTGSILVFKPELDQLLLPNKAALSVSTSTSNTSNPKTSDQSSHKQPTETGRVAFNQLIPSVATQFPEFQIGTWEMFNDGHTADMIYLTKYDPSTDHMEWYKVFLDPYQNKILSVPQDLHHYFTDWLLELHYTLLTGTTGIGIVSLLGLFLITLGVSGIALHKKFWKRFFTLRWSVRGRPTTTIVRLSDLHKLVGIWFSPILLILAITGGYWNIALLVEELNHPVATIEQKTNQANFSLDIDFDGLIEDSKQRVSRFEPTYLVLAFEKDVNIRVIGKVPTSNPLHSNYGSGSMYDPFTGKFISKWDIRELGLLSKTLDSFINLHFGTFGGLTSRIVWSATGIAISLLSVVGTLLWWRRRTEIERKELFKLNSTKGKEDPIQEAA